MIITYDDSDGWYDHSYATPTSASYSTADLLNGTATCGTGTQKNGVSGLPVNGRCGPGVRVPFIVISKYAKRNYVSHTPITQASVVKFIEDNWLAGARLGGGSFDDSTGQHRGSVRLFGSEGAGIVPEPANRHQDRFCKTVVCCRLFTNHSPHCTV
ncbi:MAG: alkaline phosphatase family protein [Rhizomicrobium sp.]